MSGKFITLEGIDGAGKSSVTTVLRDHLKKLGQVVEIVREPGGTKLAEELRQTLLKHRDEHVLPITEVLILFAGRAQHLNERIRPALESGKWVLCDRFSDSTIAYQGGGHQIDMGLLFEIANHIHSEFWPDRTYLLDVPVDVGMQRKQGTQFDRIELQDRAFFERTRAAYLDLAKAHNRIVLIDSSQKFDQVVKTIFEDISENLI